MKTYRYMNAVGSTVRMVTWVRYILLHNPLLLVAVLVLLWWALRTTAPTFSDQSDGLAKYRLDLVSVVSCRHLGPNKMVCRDQVLPVGQVAGSGQSVETTWVKTGRHWLMVNLGRN